MGFGSAYEIIVFIGINFERPERFLTYLGKNILMIGTIGFHSFAVKCLNMPTFQTDTDQSGKTIYNVWGMRQRSETVPQMDGETLTVVTGRTLGFLVVSY